MLEPTGRGSREFLPAALLPGAERSFAAAEVEGSPCSVVDGVPVGWSEGKTKRLCPATMKLAGRRQTRWPVG
jgi:hypothetical protein